MKKLNSLFSRLVIVAVLVLVSGPQVYAYGISQFNFQSQEIPSVAQLEAQFESQLSTRDEPYDQPKATSYYDDKVDHYEQVLIMSDFIDKGIR